MKKMNVVDKILRNIKDKKTLKEINNFFYGK